jgi:hypothetical protein
MSQVLVNGHAISFGTAGNYKGWAVVGWSQDPDQADVTWMDGPVAGLEFVTPAPSVDLQMSIKLAPFDGGSVNQQLYIFLNGLFVDLLSPVAKGFRDYSTLIRRSYFSTAKDATNLLNFVAPNAISPTEAGTGPDQRKLSFAFMKVTLLDPTRRARIA